MNQTYETLKIETPEDHVMVVTLNRPERMNAINTQMGTELREFFASFYVDQQNLNCIVLTGAGSRAFCAGGDLKQRNEMTDGTWQNQHAVFEQMNFAMMDCPVPIIAAVNGAAYGGVHSIHVADEIGTEPCSEKFPALLIAFAKSIN